MHLTFAWLESGPLLVNIHRVHWCIAHVPSNAVNVVLFLSFINTYFSDTIKERPPLLPTLIGDFNRYIPLHWGELRSCFAYEGIMLNMNFLRSWNDIHYHEWIQGQGSRHQRSFACLLFDVMLYSSDRVWHASVFLQQPCLIKKSDYKLSVLFCCLKIIKRPETFLEQTLCVGGMKNFFWGIIFTLLERDPFSVQVIFVLAYMCFMRRNDESWKD